MKVSMRTMAAIGIVVTAAIVGAGAHLAGQAPQALADGTLAGLTAEVRSLRLSIEDAAKTQSRVQSYGVYLTVQKDRMLQATQRLDALRHELQEYQEGTRGITIRLAEVETQLKSVDLIPAGRNELEAELRRGKAVLAERAPRESQMLQGVQDAEAQVNTENGHWNELVSQLEQLIRR